MVPLNESACRKVDISSCNQSVNEGSVGRDIVCQAEGDTDMAVLVQ